MVSSAFAALAREPFTLDSVRAQVRQDYGSVEHLSADALAGKLQLGNVLLIDVREGPEYEVSRIAGAKRADPGMWRSTFMEKFGGLVKGKSVIFYCSVGVRSSQLAKGVQSALKERGALDVYNLDGGVFGWHNDKRPLVDATGATDFVHPYDSYWGKLLDRRNKTRNSP